MNINPMLIQKYLPAQELINRGLHPRRLHGRVIADDSVFNLARSIYELDKIKYCLQHFVDGVSWHLLPVEKAQPERYELLDRIYAEAKSTGKFQRCENNILVHLRNGEPFFGEGGYHRLAIALILGLKSVPADVGLIYNSKHKGGE